MLDQESVHQIAQQQAQAAQQVLQQPSFSFSGSQSQYPPSIPQQVPMGRPAAIGSQVAPQPSGTQAPQMDRAKIEWMAQAKMLNPSTNEKTLSDVYDQKVIPSQMLERQPWETHAQAQKREEKEGYQEIKNKLIPPSEGMGTAFMKGVIRGAKDIGQGAKQLYYKVREDYPEQAQRFLMDSDFLMAAAPFFSALPKGTTKEYTNHVNKEIEEYEKETASHPVAGGAGRFVGAILASLPLGGIGAPEGAAVEMLGSQLTKHIVGGALQGATIGGLEFDPTGKNREFRTVMGGVLGGILGGTMYGAKNIFNWLRRSPTITDDPAVMEAAAARVKEAKELGIDSLTAGAATRVPHIQEVENQILKKSGPAADLLRAEQEKISAQIYEAGNKMIDAIGGEPLANDILGENVQTALTKIKGKASNAISEMYEQAANAPGANSILDRAAILNTYGDILEDFADVKFSPRITKTLENLAKANNFGFEEAFSVKDANFLVKLLNNSYRNTTNLENKSAISILKSKVLDAIDTVAEQKNNPSAQLFNLARHLRREVGDVYDSSNIVSAISKVKGRFSNYMAPEKVATRIFGKRENITNLNEIEKALTYVLPADKWVAEAKKLNPKINTVTLNEIYENQILPAANAGKAAWDNLRATKFNDIMQNSTIWPGGTPQLSYKKLVNQLKQVGMPAFKKLLGDEGLANKFQKLVNTMDAFQNKAPTNVNLKDASSTLGKLAKSIFGTIGGGEDSPIKGFVSFPLSFVRGILNHVADENWVRTSLKFGAQAEPVFSQIMRKDPGAVMDTIRNLSVFGLLQPGSVPEMYRNEGGI